MKLFNTTWFGIGGAIAMAMLAVLMAPRAAHAVVAALVQVANTAANPVPNLDTERNARTVYEATAQTTGSCPNGTGVQNCIFTFTTPPAGYRLVVQNVSGFLSLVPGATAPPTGFLTENDAGLGVYTYWAFTGSLGQPISGLVYGTFNQPTVAVFDANEPAPTVNVIANYLAGQANYMTLSGYLENCAVATCGYKAH
jgi:hypothetical protein